MRFLLYSINFSPEMTGVGKYNDELLSELAAKGHNVKVITAPPYYPEWRRHEGFGNWWSKTQLENGALVYRSPTYVPKKLGLLRRIIHLCSFALSSLVNLFRQLSQKPEVVFMVQPTLFCAPAMLIFCRITGAKSVMHIQDFEIDAMLGLGMSRHPYISKVLKRVESWLLNRFDVVSSISYSMLNNAKEKGVAEDRLLFFPNWADTEFVIPDVSGDRMRKAWGLTREDKVVLYSGNIGEKQGLEVVLEAAEALSSDSSVKFIIIGSGAYAKTLQVIAKRKKIANVVFKPLQEWEIVPQVLAMADVHLVVQKRGAADAVLPSKLTNILSAGGHALVTADKNTELGQIENRYLGIYTLVPPEDVKAFIEGLRRCLNLDTKKPNRIAREYAEENLNKHIIIDRFVTELENRVVKVEKRKLSRD
ncbi:MAG: WcaI family glycosyltransferase [Pseudomonadales bacterium]|nr:WcaI family glycosyltransferase [Pseudomonadales bacterium]